MLISKIKSILEVAIQDVPLSEGMKEVLSPYINFEGSEHNTLKDSFLDEQINKFALKANFITSKKVHSMNDMHNTSNKTDNTYYDSNEHLNKSLSIEELTHNKTIGDIDDF